MNENEIIDVMREGIMLILTMSLPVMLIGLAVGVSVALIQALTQIQEMTLVFIPKIIAIFVALFFLLPSMTLSLIEFMQTLADRIIALK